MQGLTEQDPRVQQHGGIRATANHWHSFETPWFIFYFSFGVNDNPLRQGQSRSGRKGGESTMKELGC